MKIELIDQIILLCFFVNTLLAGVLSGKNIQTAKQYILADRNYGTFTLTIALFATLIGGYATIGNIAEIFKVGYVYLLLFAGFLIGAALLANFVLIKFDSRFDKMLSLTDMLQGAYGRKAELFGGVLSLIWGVIMVGMQIMTISMAISHFAEIEYHVCAIICSIIITLYCVTGGIKAVTTTDLLAFLFLVLAFFIIALLCSIKGGGIANIIDQVPDTHKEVFKHHNINEYICLLFLYSMPFTLLWPSFIHRCLMAKNATQIKKITNSYNYHSFILMIMLCIIASYAIIKYPTQSPESVFFFLIDEMIPIGIKGIVISGIIAAIISSADSFLNTSAVNFALSVTRNRDDKTVIRNIRYTSLAIGSLSLLVALKKIPIFDTIVLLDIFLTGITIPIFIKILGYKCAPDQFFTSNALCISSFLILFYIKQEPFYICALISTLLCLFCMIFYSHIKKLLIQKCMNI